MTARLLTRRWTCGLRQAACRRIPENALATVWPAAQPVTVSDPPPIAWFFCADAGRCSASRGIQFGSEALPSPLISVTVALIIQNQCVPVFVDVDLAIANTPIAWPRPLDQKQYDCVAALPGIRSISRGHRDCETTQTYVRRLL
jgi:hypothetical protein